MFNKSLVSWWSSMTRTRSCFIGAPFELENVIAHPARDGVAMKKDASYPRGVLCLNFIKSLTGAKIKIPAFVTVLMNF
jgi:hypothetical protein